MKRLALVALAAANMLFVLSFLALLLFATGRASAGEAACSGRNLLEEAAADRPGLVRELRRQAAAVPNGEGLLWRVEAGAATPSYLFGTMHVSDPRVVEMSAPARAAFAGARTIVVETTDVLDFKAMMAAIAQNMELTMFPQGESLRDHLTPEQEALVSAALAERGVPFASVVKMKPWMLVSLVALPGCEVERRQAGAVVLDMKLAREAEAAGKRLVGLESFAEQLSAFASLPIELHVQALISTLALGERRNDMMETLTALYLRGDTGMAMPALKGLLENGPEAAVSHAAFEERIIDMRNRVMAERAAPLLAQGGTFVAVGAMHLPGEKGLVALLREAGLTVERAD